VEESRGPKLLVGLGNPGPRYEGTRHNVGFEAVDRILASCSGRGRWVRGREGALEAEAEVEGRRVALMKPLTYMNLSGGPVAEWARAHSITRTEILVYYDDVALSIGTLRLRERGTDGGHRGLASILGALGGVDVPRGRIGIRPANDGAMNEELADFVLAPFTREERQRVDEVLERVVAATRMVLVEGIAKAMSRYNAKSSTDAQEP
jgi:peptidyl-tRNA hydrolase, PTH1 family